MNRLIKKKKANNELVKKHFNFQSPSIMLKPLNDIKDMEKNNKVNAINSELKDLKEEIKEMSQEQREIEKPDNIVKIVEDIIKFIKQTQQGKDLKNFNTKPNA